ncbi:MAG: transcriptional regulator [Candidatus Latescibacteria bacterium]|nr:transcriptional regulator [Candidatus Latescibacterota bacterium]
MNTSHADRLLELVERKGILRPRDLEPHHIPRIYLNRLTKRGLLRQVGRGLYMSVTAEPTEHHSLAEACKRVPQGVVCLLSALRFHDLTTQLPYEVWMAIPGTTRRPTVRRPALRFHRFSGQALTDGIAVHSVEGVQVKVYHPAKTVADCFKFRNKIGLDIAIEALKDGILQRKVTPDELWRYAVSCRMTQVMQPYIEALV